MPKNALAAVAIAFCYGVAVDDICHVLQEFAGVEHRLEYVATLNGVEYFNDSKATNTDAAMEALDFFPGGILLIAGGKNKDMNFAPWVQMFKQKVEKLILIGEAAKDIASVCQNTGFSDYCFADSLQEAVVLAKSFAKRGQIVLLSPSCASFDMFKDYEERGKLFKNYVKGVDV